MTYKKRIMLRTIIGIITLFAGMALILAFSRSYFHLAIEPYILSPIDTSRVWIPILVMILGTAGIILAVAMFFKHNTPTTMMWGMDDYDLDQFEAILHAERLSRRDGKMRIKSVRKKRSLKKQMEIAEQDQDDKI